MHETHDVVGDSEDLVTGDLANPTFTPITGELAQMYCVTLRLRARSTHAAPTCAVKISALRKGWPQNDTYRKQ